MIAIIEEAIRSIETEKQAKMDSVRSEVFQNKIIPYNAMIDDRRNNALAELESKKNAEMENIRQRYEAESQKLVEATEQNKKSYETDEVNKALAMVTISYDKTISKLKELANVQE